MKIKYFNNKIDEINSGIFTEGSNIGKPTYLDFHEVKEVFIDGKWLPNEGFDLDKYKKQKSLIIENKLLEIYKEKQICENNNLREKFNSLVIEQEKLEKQKEEINAL